MRPGRCRPRRQPQAPGGRRPKLKSWLSSLYGAGFLLPALVLAAGVNARKIFSKYLSRGGRRTRAPTPADGGCEGHALGQLAAAGALHEEIDGALPDLLRRQVNGGE